MRQIKFRAFNLSDNRMYYQSDGLRLKLNHDGGISAMILKQDAFKCELMQFTGLLDKNGKEIYEGDRLKDSSGYIWVVYWYEDHACFGCYDESLPHIKHEIIDNLNFKVIGNVFENPELLNQ